jgi:hypothetical protein
MDAIGVAPGMVIGEAGAGDGYFTLPVARRVGPTGIVYANDISTRALRELEQRGTREGLANVRTVVGGVDDPLFPQRDLQLVVVVLGNTSAYPSSTTNLTVMFWVSFDVAKDPAKHRTVYEFSDSWVEGQPAWGLVAWSGPELYFEPFNGDSTWAEDDYLDLLFGVTDDTLVLGQWYHMAYVEQGDAHTLYCDGAETASGSLVQSENSNGWASVAEWFALVLYRHRTDPAPSCPQGRTYSQRGR